MRSYMVTEFGEPLSEVEAPTPEPKGAEVLLKVSACGVCHSDVHLWGGYFDLGDGKRASVTDRGVKPPFTLGHEITGTVAALGPGAEGVAVGERRMVFPWIGCGECAVCESGVENLCEAPRSIGVRRDGGYADYVLVPHGRYLLDATGIPDDLSAVYTCSGITAYSALKKIMPLADGEKLLLIGAGGVGHMGIRFAAAMSGAKILVADIDSAKLDAAREAGADHTIDCGQDGAAKAILELSGGGVAAVVDFVGSPQSTGLGIGVLKRGGALVIVGLYGGALNIPLVTFPFRAISVRGSYVGTLSEMRELLDLVRAGKVTPVPVERRPLEQASAALADLEAGRIIGRIVLTP